MAPKEIEDWLDTEHSRDVGYKGDDAPESVGHASGRRIVKILRTKKANLDADDAPICARSSAMCIGTRRRGRTNAPTSRSRRGAIR